MKILMVIDNMNLGGAQKMFAFLANQFSEIGYDVCLLSYSTQDSFFSLSDKVEFVGGSAYKGSSVLRHLRKIPFIREQINRLFPDIIIAFSTIPSILSKLAAFNLKIPVVFCERGDPYQYKSVLEKIKLKSARICDYSVFQTEAAREYYPTRMRENSSVIPNPVSEKLVERTDYRKRNRSIVFVGRFDLHQKRQDLMLDAFCIVSEKYGDVVLEFYGDGDDYQKTVDLVNSKHLQNRVRFKGKIIDVKNEIIDSLMYVISSDYEGIPNSLIEAMSLGIPCVSTDCSPGGAKLLIDNKKNGLLVPCNNPEELAKAMIYIIEHPKEANDMGIEAQKIVDKFSPNKIIDMWIRMINKVAR